MMPISATGSKGTCGFSLVELMVVLAIIGVLSAIVVLRLPGGGGAPLREAQGLAAGLTAARIEAVTGARAIRIVVSPGGAVAEQRRRGRWVVLPGKALMSPQWPEGVVAEPAELVFDPTGTASGAEQLVLTRGGEAARVLISAEGDIGVAR